MDHLMVKLERAIRAREHVCTHGAGLGWSRKLSAAYLSCELRIAAILDAMRAESRDAERKFWGRAE